MMLWPALPRGGLQALRGGPAKEKNVATSSTIAECEVRAWTHPVGTKVLVRLDCGTLHEGTTRSMPWVLGGHTAVILVTGISGAYRLSRVAVPQ